MSAITKSILLYLSVSWFQKDVQILKYKKLQNTDHTGLNNKPESTIFVVENLQEPLQRLKSIMRTDECVSE